MKAQLLNKMKLCLATTRDLNTAIISKDECQRRDLARRVLTLCDVLLVLLPAQVVGLYFAIKKSFRFLLSTETNLNSTISIRSLSAVLIVISLQRQPWMNETAKWRHCSCFHGA
jgi:hypothetical protein